jgi:hypothetical protein
MAEPGQNEVVRSFIERVVGQGDIEAAREFFGNQSDPMIQRVQEAVRRLHRAVPDVEVSIDHIVAQPDEVVVFHTLHAKPTQEVAPDVPVDIGVCALFKLEGTKLTGVTGYLSRPGAQTLSLLRLSGEDDDWDLWPYGITPPDKQPIG